MGERLLCLGLLPLIHCNVQSQQGRSREQWRGVPVLFRKEPGQAPGQFGAGGEVCLDGRRVESLGRVDVANPLQLELQVVVVSIGQDIDKGVSERGQGSLFEQAFPKIPIQLGIVFVPQHDSLFGPEVSEDSGGCHAHLRSNLVDSDVVEPMGLECRQRNALGVAHGRASIAISEAHSPTLAAVGVPRNLQVTCKSRVNGVHWFMKVQLPAPVNVQAVRITNLDLVRGIAVLGILGMNAVSFGLGTAPYFNVSAGGIVRPYDWIAGGFGEVFIDQKFMGLFSMLFGAGVVLFCDRAKAKGRSPWRLALWRNALLLLVGLAHARIWDGDILVIYALSAPVLIAMRNQSLAVLWAAGIAAVLASPVVAVWAQGQVGPAGEGLGAYWANDGDISDAVGTFLLTDFSGRALGMMLIGIALYRSGVITGERPSFYYRWVGRLGSAEGLALAAVGFWWVASRDFSTEVALIGSIPNTLGTISASIGYLAFISLWNMGPDARLKRALRAVGRMALTNYLMQTVLGVLLLRELFDPATLSRTTIAGFVVAVWVAQLLWSPWWLARYRFGPLEWLWRSATYGRLQDFRRVQ